MPVAQNVFSADAGAQLGGAKPAVTNGNLAGSAVGQFQSLIQRDAARAEHTAAYGFKWDSASTSISLSSISQPDPNTVNAVLNVTNMFHIEGRPNDGSSTSESGAMDPYTISFVRIGSAWKIGSITAVQPTDAANPTVVVPATAPTSHASTRAVASAQGAFNVSAAINYAYVWWNGFNPNYAQYGNDCQNFVSQIMHAGGIPYDLWNSWEPGYAPWINVGYFKYWAQTWGPFSTSGSAWSSYPGDAVQFNWTGGTSPDHSMFVDGFSGSVPLLSGHTNPRWNYPLTSVISTYPSVKGWALHPHSW